MNPLDMVKKHARKDFEKKHAWESGTVDKDAELIFPWIDALIDQVALAVLEMAEENISQLIHISDDANSTDWFQALRAARSSVGTLKSSLAGKQ